MEFQEVVQRRRMVRRFTGEQVTQQSLDRILANAVKGPSAGFSQGQAFLVLTGLDLAEFWKVTGEPDSQTAENAPLIIVPLSCKRIYLDRYALPDKGWTDRDEARSVESAQATVRAGALRHLVSSSHERTREQKIGDDTGQHHRDAYDGVGEAVA